MNFLNCQISASGKNYLELSIFEDIYDKKVKELDDFIKDNHVEIIDCNLLVDIEQVNSWYFKGEKPFSVSKPKEFPDAMILSAAINFFKKNKFDEVIFICEDDVFCDGVKKTQGGIKPAQPSTEAACIL